MSVRHSKIFFTLLFVFISLLQFKAIAQTETDADTFNAISDTTFIEISLSEDGVAAIDTSGNDWYFDFELDLFVPGLLERSTTPREDFEENIPIEERCIVKKNVKQATSKVVIVDFDEYVEDDIIVFGRVTVKGWVKGNITSYNNRVIVKSTGQVDGDINAPSISVQDGGVVLGEIDESSLDITSIPADLPDNGFLVIMIIMSTLCVLLFLVIALLPKKLEVVSACFNTYKLRSTFLGFIIFILMPVVALLVAITIVGIVVVPLIPFLYVFAAILGIASFSHTIGSLVFGKYLSSENRIYMKTFLGFSLFAISWILGITLMGESENSVKFGFGVFFFVNSIIFSIVPVFGGIGASLLTRFGTRPYQSWKKRMADNPESFTPAPPPMPQGPEIKTPPRRSDNS